ncbi:Interleukin-5 [Microtus ochrogaster]|uniref:Interleukin-5 n=1 Tax=Microtus ochrogaster TaxID=79684 RepID=A0A8J6KZY2_MICOH|nr:Interleukin-5 [Microtus ochrogaster]
MRVLLHWSVLTLVCVWTTAMEIPMSTVVKETLTQLSMHRALLTSNEHQLCIGEIFQGLDMLKNQTVRGGTVETLFQNLSLIKKYIDRQKEQCSEERRRTRQFLDYLQEFLGVLSTEWTMED